MFTIVTIGLTDAGFCSACTRLCAALLESSLDEIIGTINCLGDKYTVSDIIFAVFNGCMTYGIYSDSWLVLCTRQVPHVVPRMLYPLACYESLLFSLGEILV